jgi:hypothetical protein
VYVSTTVCAAAAAAAAAATAATALCATNKLLLLLYILLRTPSQIYYAVQNKIYVMTVPNDLTAADLAAEVATTGTKSTVFVQLPTLMYPNYLALDLRPNSRRAYWTG